MNMPAAQLLAPAEAAAVNAWAARGWCAPAPDFVKRQVLVRNGFTNGTWVETGTFMGATTEVLMRHAAQVVSIEPEPTLHARAKARFADQPHVHLVNGLSEVVFPKLLPLLGGAVNFWLDGHFSAGETHQGPVDTPIRQELAEIAAHRARWPQLCVCVDDLRLFGSAAPEAADYPPLAWLVEWAEAQKLHWHIEHDIFVARSERAA